VIATHTRPARAATNARRDAELGERARCALSITTSAHASAPRAAPGRVLAIAALRLRALSRS
jgi:hypothetical protein